MMSDSYKYGYPSGPFYRKFMVGDIGVEVNRDGNGGLYLHMWHCTPDQDGMRRNGTFHFDSEDQFMEFCTKLLGVDHNGFEEFWLRWG
jgi:hypothetical protein